MQPFAVIIPAAGGSSRLGRPKQLIAFEGESLVRRAARTALEAGAAQVIVVVGAYADQVSDALAGLAIEAFVNEEWREGMGASIRCGAREVSAQAEAVVISLCDTPLVSAELVRALADAVSAGEVPIAAAEYDGVVGPPCAFHSSLFPALRMLGGDQGARELIRSAPSVARLPFAGGRLDLDTPDDLAQLEAMPSNERATSRFTEHRG